jgi:Uma2 family endonuclease
MLVARSPIGGVHSYVVTRLHEALYDALGKRGVIQVQGPFAATDESEPEPDLLVLPREGYSPQKPRHALLVVEVADSSLRIDRGFKRQLYAGIGIKDFWLVNIPQGVIEVYRGPRKRSYARCTVYRRGQSVSPLAFPDVRIAVGEVLP